MKVMVKLEVKILQVNRKGACRIPQSKVRDKQVFEAVQYGK